MELVSKRRLFYDIETSPNVILDFSCGYGKSVKHHQIVRERQVICISYSWNDEEEIHSIDWGEEGSDEKMLREFAKILESCTEAVAHNGDKFDVKWLRGRFAFWQIEFTPYLKTIDTYKMSKKYFNYNSHALAYLGKLWFGLGKVQHEGWILWERLTLENKEEDRVAMVEYCEGDIMLLKKVYKRLVNYGQPSMHYGVLVGFDRWSCPECASVRVKHKRKYVTKMGTISHSWQCKECKKCYKTNNKVYEDWIKYRILKGAEKNEKKKE